MKNKSKHRSNKNNKRLRIRQCSSYEPDFKKAVVLYAEQKSTSEAKRRYGISESNIRRWRRLRNDIMEKASQPVIRKSQRTKTAFEGSVEDFDCSSSLDSMPLEQRLSNKTPTEQEPVLQSQPLSPTKLKVTRQTTKPTQGSQKPPTPEPPNEEVCLRWNSHHSNMQNTFPNLLMREQYVDATLVAEGQTLKCHRLILSSCSPYFEEVLSGISPFQHPVLFMKDIPFWILKSLCDFMYAGEVHIFQNKLEELLAVAETLKIKGLAGKLEGGNDETKSAESAKTVKEDKKVAPERKEEKEMREKKKQPPAKDAEVPAPKPKFVRSTHNSKRAAEKAVVNKDEVLDPLDLLEPVYEELATDTKQTSMLTRFRETRNFPVKKSLPKKLKKRKLCDEREESPPMFISRKGTRSRPNVKIPKYYHTHYERAAKLEDTLESTIVREPHTDPLMQVEEIKAEPLDIDDDVIEIEDNVVGYNDQEMPQQEEEIFGSYDAPMFNLQNKSDANKDAEETTFKKINLMSQPIIMDVHSVPDKSPDTLKIVNVAEIKTAKEDATSKSSDLLVATLNQKTWTTEAVEQNTSSLTITSIATVVETNASEESSKAEDEPEVTTTIVEINAGAENSKREDDPVRTSGITIANVESVAEIETAIIETIVKSGHITIEPVNVAAEEPVEGSDEATISITNVESITDINASETTQEHLDNEVSSEPLSTLESDPIVKENQPDADNNQTVLCTENTLTESDQAASDDRSLESEENTNALGFHIAKVASEQFTMDSDGRYTQNEESSSKLPSESEPDTVVNNLESTEESQSRDIAPDVNNASGDESEILAKSLEALLEK